MSGFRRYLQRAFASASAPVSAVLSIVVEAGRRRRTPLALPVIATQPVEVQSTVVRFKRYRDPAHINPVPVAGGAVILAFRRRHASDIDPNEPRAHAS